MSALRVHILGGLAVADGDRAVDLGPPKQRAVLAVLLLELGQVVPAERIIELLWGDDAPKASASLQAYISNLRRALEPDRRPRDPAKVLITQPPGYRLDLPADALDVHRFEEKVAEGRRYIAEGHLRSAITVLDQAIGLWTGPPLPELADEPFVVELSTRLRGVLGSALEAAAEARLAIGDHQGAVALLEPVAADHPFRERLHGALALALYRCGRQAAALRAIDATRRELGETAGLELGPELRKLEGQLLEQSPDLDWTPPDGAGSGPQPLQPAPVAAPIPPADKPAGPPLVGRTAELDLLVDALHTAAAGRGSTAVVIGEPGIGKTRLVEELAYVARTEGIAVCWAQCPENAAIPPYWPARRITDQLGAAGLVNQQISPRATQLNQFALHQAITDALITVTGPALLVVDDLQWSDPSSLRLVEHLASQVWAGPVLVVLTVRPLLESSDPALIECLTELARTSGSIRVDLTGLSAAAVTEWLEAANDDDVSPAVAAVVHERTDGNPLFVRELSALLAHDGCLTDPDEARTARQIPSGVQLVVRRRVARAPAETQQLLPTAAVVGRRFDVEVLAEVAEEPLPVVLDRLAPAIDAGLVTATDEPAIFRFSHALVADALSAEVNAVRAAALHAATARALQARLVDDQMAAEVAHHAVAGMAAGTAQLAWEASVRAAEHATTQYAHDDAARHWGVAVEALERLRPGDHAARIDALLERAKVCQRADLLQEAEDSILAAIDLAEGDDDIEAMGRAASRLNNTVSLWPSRAYREVHPVVIGALERVLARLPEDEHATRALIMGSLSSELAFADHRERGIRMAEDGVAAARLSGDPHTLVRCLMNQYRAAYTADSLEVRQQIITEAVEVVETLDDAHGLAMVVWFAHGVVDLQSGDIDACDASLRRCDEHGRFTSHVAPQSQLGFFRALLLVIRGRHEAAREEAERAHDLYRRGRQWQADVILLGFQLTLAHDLGGALEYLDVLELVVDGGAYEDLAREYGALVLFDNGRPEEASRLLARRGTVPAPRSDYTTSLILVAAAHVRAETGDVAAAEVLYDRLLPFAGQVIANSTATPYVGLADLGLARLAALLDRPDEAREWFARSVAGHDRLGSPVWLARSLLHQGRFLLSTGDEGDQIEGSRALFRGGCIAEAMNLAPLAGQIAGLTAAEQGADGAAERV
jgi:DNA-binding SARP family transcriptional activator